MEVLLLTMQAQRMWTRHLIATQQRLQSIIGVAQARGIPLPKKERQAYIDVLLKVIRFSASRGLIVDNMELMTEFTETAVAFANAILQRHSQIADDLVIITRGIDDPSQREQALEAIKRLQQIFDA